MNTTVDFGPLSDLMEDPEITIIMVNRYDSVFVWHHWRGREAAKVGFDDEAQVRRIAENIVKAGNGTLNYEHPIAEVSLLDGSTVTAIIPPIASRGTTIQIIKPNERTEQNFEWGVEVGVFSQQAADFLQAAVRARANTAVIGGYNAGKTTMLHVMAQVLPEPSRIVIIQPKGDLSLPHANQVVLEHRKPDLDGKGAVSPAYLMGLVRQLYPDRILISELVGEQVPALFDLMKVGHNVLFTLDAINPRDTVTRLEQMATAANLAVPLLSIREEIARNLHLIVHMEWMDDGFKRMVGISEVRGLQGDSVAIEPIFIRNRDTGNKMVATGVVPQYFNTIKSYDIDLPESTFNPPK